VTVVAQNIAFDTAQIDLPADAPTTITFDNRDAGMQHNIAIYNDSSLAENLFTGDIVTGPATAEYQVPGLPAGEYYFHCDVHPNMSGSVVVGGGGGGGPPTGGTGSSCPRGRPSDPGGKFPGCYPGGPRRGRLRNRVPSISARKGRKR
jgi:plastocyanin